MEISKNTALLVMDVQNNIINRMNPGEGFFNPLKKVITNARYHKILVLYVVVGFRKGFPEVSPHNQSFSQLKKGEVNLDTTNASQVHAEIAPQVEDIIITKRRISAFTGSDLEVVLRANGIQHLVLSGIATSGVVLSTLREAADKDYQLTVLSDCCADRDEEVHRVLTTKVFPRQAEVITSEEWCS